MSHQTKISTGIKNLDAFARAAEKMGCHVTRDAKWRIYAGMSNVEADLVISHHDCAYDVAVIKQADGTYTLSSDWSYIGRGLKTANQMYGLNGELLMQQVVAEESAIIMEPDYQIEETKLDGGWIQLTCVSNKA